MTTIRLDEAQKKKLAKAARLLEASTGRKLSQGDAVEALSEFALRNRELANAAKVDDFIVSEQLVSLMMAQFSENAELFGVFSDIYDPEGSEIYLKPAGDYVAGGQAVNFYTVAEAARRRNETAIGYRLSSQASDAAKTYGVRTNPRKSETVTFGPQDKVIVIAEG